MKARNKIGLNSIMRTIKRGTKMRLNGEIVVGEDEIVYGAYLDHIGKAIQKRLFYYEIFS